MFEEPQRVGVTGVQLERISRVPGKLSFKDSSKALRGLGEGLLRKVVLGGWGGEGTEGSEMDLGCACRWRT
jgi:hypothetical protein